MRVGVIGAGAMGTLHASSVARSGAHTLAAVADMDRERAARLASASGGAQVFRDGRELIESDLVDAVIVASPDPTHAPLAAQCLKANKPVLVEKPLAADLAAAQEIVELEGQRQDRLIQLGFMRHYDRDHIQVSEAISSGRIGRPFFFRGWHRSPLPSPPMSRRDVLVNSAVHDIESARWLLGREPVEVLALGPNREKGIDEFTDVEVISVTMGGSALARRSATPARSSPNSGAAARHCREHIQAGMLGINIGVAGPMAFFPFNGIKGSFFGDLHAMGKDGVRFFTENKVEAVRWFSRPEAAPSVDALTEAGA